MGTNKILTKNKSLETIQFHKERGETVVFTNGCFDVLHVGHLSLLEQAKGFGDILCVGINSDDSVRKLKGESRPVNNQFDRATLLAALEVVDYVTVFEEETPCEIISRLQPNVHVKGGDYNPEDYRNMPEAKVVKEYGGEVKIVKIVEGKSSSSILSKMNYLG